VARGPTYLIFPIISLSPVVTIALSFVLMRERTGRLGALGIVLALLALPTFDFAPAGGGGASAEWLVPAMVVMLCWAWFPARSRPSASSSRWSPPCSSPSNPTRGTKTPNPLRNSFV
ncbi:MAG TPA: hypothetical protein VMQ93_04035, partial [Novosphingobium sp.]|nr:hypothetical protein [Novosphingobium sp.]